MVRFNWLHTSREIFVGIHNKKVQNISNLTFYNNLVLSMFFSVALNFFPASCYPSARHEGDVTGRYYMGHGPNLPIYEVIHVLSARFFLSHETEEFYL